MDLDELEPVKKKRVLKDLDILSIEALGEYIEEFRRMLGGFRTDLGGFMSMPSGLSVIVGPKSLTLSYCCWLRPLLLLCYNVIT